MRFANDRLRIAVQLINGQTDRRLWAETYERDLTVANVFGIQQELAASIAAYDAYLLGRYHTFQQTHQDLQKAVQRLQNAVELDSNFAEAWAELG